MTNHPTLQIVIERIEKDLIGGAADTAKEMISALAAVARDSHSTSPEAFAAEIEQAVIKMLQVMPSLAPPINALHRVLAGMDSAIDSGASGQALKDSFLQECDRFLRWSETAIHKVAQYGAEKIRDGDTVFTYSMSSTVWRIFRKAKSQGKQFSIVVTESRPTDEGYWTVREMDQEGIPVAISADANIGELVPKSNSVFVGADAISSNGYSLCKVGTYPTALVAKAHKIPMYVAADTLKFDPTTLLGLPYRIEEFRREHFLIGEYSERVKVIGKIFDETPPDYVTAVITEIGLIHPTACVTILQQMHLSDRLNAILPAYVRGEL